MRYETTDYDNYWYDIESAPKDGSVFLAYAPPKDGLPFMYSLCAWHPDAGFCVDEIREPTHWNYIPKYEKEGGQSK